MTGHAPCAQESIVVDRNRGGGQCAGCGDALRLADGVWVSEHDRSVVCSRRRFRLVVTTGA